MKNIFGIKPLQGISLNVLIQKFWVLVTILGNLTEVLKALKQFVIDLKKAKENDGKIDEKELWAAAEPLLKELDENFDLLQKFIKLDMNKISKVDCEVLDKMNCTPAPIPIIPPISPEEQAKKEEQAKADAEKSKVVEYPLSGPDTPPVVSEEPPVKEKRKADDKV